MIYIAASHNMRVFGLDFTNAFQTSINGPGEGIYIYPPYKYMQWYSRKFPKYPINKMDPKTLCIPCLRNMQGTKSAGHDWYSIIHGLLCNLGLQRSSSDHGVFSWIYTGDDTLAPKNSCRYKGIICLATDDILLIAENKILFSR